MDQNYLRGKGSRQNKKTKLLFQAALLEDFIFKKHTLLLHVFEVLYLLSTHHT